MITECYLRQVRGYSIVVCKIDPPMPVSKSEWSASIDGEEGGIVVFGITESVAITDLITCLQELEK